MPLRRTTTLPNGLRVRLRLPVPSDAARLRVFRERLGLTADDLGTGRLVRFDPRSHTVLCATAFTGADDELVGFGAIADGADAPYALLADDERAPGVRALLADTLREHARRHAA